jgi:hypothetical protein
MKLEKWKALEVPFNRMQLPIVPLCLPSPGRKNKVSFLSLGNLKHGKLLKSIATKCKSSFYLFCLHHLVGKIMNFFSKLNPKLV